VSYARESLGLSVRLGTLEEASFDGESFDCVWLSHVVEHVPDPVRLMREVARVLAPGGIAVVSVPSSAGLVYAATNVVHRLRGRYRKDKFACSLAPPGHLFAFAEPSLRALLSAAGLRVELLLQSGKGDPVFYPVLSWKGAGKFPLAIRAVESLGRRIGRGSMLVCFARKP
jgi:SAM-dependent methyltransferase